MEAFFVADHGAFVRYLDLPGADPARVYLHGFLGSSIGGLTHIAAHDALRGHRSLMVDFLGYGFSDKPQTFGYRIEDHADVVVRLLDHLGLRDVHLIGHSLGGCVATVVASERPDLVSALVVAEANLDRGRGGLSLRVVEWSERDFVEKGFEEVVGERQRAATDNPDGVVARHLGMVRLSAPYAVHRAARSLVTNTEPPVRSRLRDMEIRRAYIVGDRSDETLPPQDDLVESGVQWFTIPDATHIMHLDNPSAFAHAVADALA